MIPRIISHVCITSIIPAIRVRKNSTGKVTGCYPRKLSVISQLTNYNYWRMVSVMDTVGLWNLCSRHSRECLGNMLWLDKKYDKRTGTEDIVV